MKTIRLAGHLLAALLAAFGAHAQPANIQLANGSFVFQLPAGWQAHPNNAETGKKGVYIYGKSIADRNGNPIVPTCAFILIPTTSTDVVKLYAARSINRPKMKVDRTFTSQDGFISISNAIGIKGSFSNTSNEVRDLILVDALSTARQLLVETVCESPRDEFRKVDADFRAILASMNFR